MSSFDNVVADSLVFLSRNCSRLCDKLDGFNSRQFSYVVRCCRISSGISFGEGKFLQKTVFFYIFFLKRLTHPMILLFTLQMSPKKWSKNTFGWARAEVLGALVNAVFLVALCFSITVEACKRFIEVEEIHEPRLLVGVGALGLLVNIIGLCLFHGECTVVSHTTNFILCSSKKTYKIYFDVETYFSELFSSFFNNFYAIMNNLTVQSS